jgi:hypothetical protein
MRIVAQTVPPGGPGTAGSPEPVLPPTEPDIGPDQPDIHPQPDPGDEPPAADQDSGDESTE